MNLSFHRLAAREMRDAREWYADRNPDVATRFVEAADEAVARILDNPLSHPIERKHYRFVRLRTFPYRLIFEQPDDESILVIAVAHSSRRPSYWRDRK